MAVGWRSGHRYLPLQDDIAGVAYWYQVLPAAKFPKLPAQNYKQRNRYGNSPFLC